ncbi:MAG TPA: molybdate ABC transporter substrate-binding protein, partial [Ruminiclostridium sp.]|jgi:molybdate transport system substrate-binding protein|nr:molybdate ABC transporter substrate-binding protein [Ruminiclostridium sp.]
MCSIKKNFLMVLMTLLLLGMSIGSVSAASNVNVAIDGSPLSIEAANGAPYIDSANRTMVPIRVVSENLGAQVSWDASTQTATIDGSIKIEIGSNIIQTPYGQITMDTNAVVQDGRTYIPFRFIANALGYDATWTDSTSTADVITKSDLTISAAASLKNALEEVKALYLAQKPNAKVAISYGGSGALQQQIEQGAPADLFFSAATSNMKALQDKDLLDNNTIKNLLQNKVVMITPIDSTLSIGSFKDVTNDSIQKLALGEPTTVPAGKYGLQVFTYYNLADEAKAKAVYAKDVTEVLTWVASGNADAGVVYSTDAASSDKVKVITTAPEDSHDPVTYPGAVIKSTKQPVAAQDFLNFITSDLAKAVFVKYGFTVL